jgi:hypothetical protein
LAERKCASFPGWFNTRMQLARMCFHTNLILLILAMAEVTATIGLLSVPIILELITE